MSSKAIDVQAGWLDMFGSAIFATSSVIHVAALAEFQAYGSLFNAVVTLDSTSFGLFVGNVFQAAPVDNSPNGFQFVANTGAQVPPQKTYPTVGALSIYGTCAAGQEGRTGTQNNSTAACSAGATATSAGTTHCAIYCNGTNWIQLGY